MKRGAPLRPVSQMRRDEKERRDAVKREVDHRDGPGCYAGVVINRRRATALARGWPVTCSGPFDYHEVIPRSVWPGSHLIVSNVRKVCRKHHDWIDGHEIDAATLGLHGYSWDVTRGRCQNEGCGELLNYCRCPEPSENMPADIPAAPALDAIDQMIRDAWIGQRP